MAATKPAKKAAAPTSITPSPTMVASLTASLQAMTLTPADRAAVTLAHKYARAIDAVIADPASTPGDLTKALYLGPHLLNALIALGGTPAARGETGAPKPKGGTISALATLRTQVQGTKP